MKYFKKITVLIAYLVPLVVLGQGAIALEKTSLCSLPEKSVFTCQTNGKIAVLCASKLESDIKLRYVFGKADKAELSFPSNLVVQQPFTHGTIMASGIGGDYIKFTNGGFNYYLVMALGHNIDKTGILIRKGDKIVSTLICGKNSFDEFTTDFFNKAKIPLDAGEDLEIPDAFFK